MSEGDHSEQHLREARELTVFGGGAGQEQLEVQLGHVCNNRCVFCVSGQLTEQRIARPIPADPVLSALEKARARGVTRVTFLGGEPTVQRSFLPSFERAVELGFREIVVFTNGVKTRKPGFVEQLHGIVARNPDARLIWRFSIQGGNAEAHDQVTKRRGSFDRIMLGMTHARRLGGDVTANMCVNEESYRSLPDFPALIERYEVRQLHIDMIRPADAGVRTDAYLRSIMPRYSDMAPYFAEMLEGFDARLPGFDINVGNFPYCVLPRWAHRIHHDGELTMTVAANGSSELSEPWNKYEQKRHDKHHPKQCAECVFRPQCNGIFDTYARFYGTDEFQPVTREALAELDPELHHFVLHLDPTLAAIAQSAPPQGWRLQELFRNTRDRRVELRMRSERGPATLVLTPPEGRGPAVEAPPAVYRSDRLQVGLLLAPGLEADRVLALVGWLVDGLERALPAMRVDADAPHWGPMVVGMLMPPERVRRARARMARLLGRLRGRVFGGWREVERVMLAPRWGARLVFASDDEAGRLLVDLVVQPEVGRPLVSVSYELAGIAPEAARGPLGGILSALRGEAEQGDAARG